MATFEEEFAKIKSSIAENQTIEWNTIYTFANQNFRNCQIVFDHDIVNIIQQLIDKKFAHLNDTASPFKSLKCSIVESIALFSCLLKYHQTKHPSFFQQHRKALSLCVIQMFGIVFHPNASHQLDKTIKSNKYFHKMLPMLEHSLQMAGITAHLSRYPPLNYPRHSSIFPPQLQSGVFYPEHALQMMLELLQTEDQVSLINDTILDFILNEQNFKSSKQLQSAFWVLDMFVKQMNNDCKVQLAANGRTLIKLHKMWKKYYNYKEHDLLPYKYRIVIVKSIYQLCIQIKNPNYTKYIPSWLKNFRYPDVDASMFAAFQSDKNIGLTNLKVDQISHSIWNDILSTPLGLSCFLNIISDSKCGFRIFTIDTIDYLINKCNLLKTLVSIINNMKQIDVNQNDSMMLRDKPQKYINEMILEYCKLEAVFNTMNCVFELGWDIYVTIEQQEESGYVYKCQNNAISKCMLQALNQCFDVDLAQFFYYITKFKLHPIPYMLNGIYPFHKLHEYHSTSKHFTNQGQIFNTNNTLKFVAYGKVTQKMSRVSLIVGDTWRYTMEGMTKEQSAMIFGGIDLIQSGYSLVSLKHEIVYYGFDWFGHQTGCFGIIKYIAFNIDGHLGIFLHRNLSSKCIRQIRTSLGLFANSIIRGKNNILVDDALFWHHLSLITSGMLSFVVVEIMSHKNINHTKYLENYNTITTYLKRFVIDMIEPSLMALIQLAQDSRNKSGLFSDKNNNIDISITFQQIVDRLNEAKEMLAMSYAVIGNKEKFKFYNIWAPDSWKHKVLAHSMAFKQQFLKNQSSKNKLKMESIWNSSQHQLLLVMIATMFEYTLMEQELDRPQFQEMGWQINKLHNRDWINNVIESKTRDEYLYKKWKNVTTLKICNFCKRNDRKLNKCKNCRRVFYCNKKCQKQDWNLNNHRKFCISRN